MKQYLCNFFLVTFIICVTVIIGFFFVEICFRIGPFYIIFFSVPIGLILAISVAVILTIIDRKFNFLKRKISLIIIFVLVFTLVISWGWYSYSPPSIVIFKRYSVSKTMFSSINNVNGAIEYPAFNSIVRLSFDINKKDIAKLLEVEQYSLSKDIAPFKVPNIKKYNWWDINAIKKLNQYKKINGKKMQYIWFNKKTNSAFFMKIKN